MNQINTQLSLHAWMYNYTVWRKWHKIFQELSNELNNHKEVARKQLNLKDKQIEQLVDGFQKQMQLIDVLRRQKVCA